MTVKDWMVDDSDDSIATLAELPLPLQTCLPTLLYDSKSWVSWAFSEKGTSSMTDYKPSKIGGKRYVP